MVSVKKNAGISLMALMPVIIICVGRECHSVTNSKPKKFNQFLVSSVYYFSRILIRIYYVLLILIIVGSIIIALNILKISQQNRVNYDSKKLLHREIFERHIHPFFTA